MKKCNGFVRMVLPTLIVGISGLFTSCGSSKQAVYFQDADLVNKLETEMAFQAQIQPDDLLSIVVSCENMEAAAPYNTPMSTQSLGNVSQVRVGYLVDKDGYIDFPVFGQIRVAGLSRNELADLLKEKLNTQINNPIVSIHFLNFKVTVLGEVKSPGVFTFPSERVTVLDALAHAGDIGMNGKKDNVLILREYGNEKVFAQINLTKTDFLTSPYYYLQQNDVIYVEPNRAALTQASQGRQIFGYVTSIVSTVLSLGTAVLIWLTRDLKSK